MDANNSNGAADSAATTKLAKTSAIASSSSSSSMLSLKVRLIDSNVIKTLQFNPSTLVYDALKIIREKIPETNAANNVQNYGIFIPNNDPTKETWLENGRTLDYYCLKNGDTVEYRDKFRKLVIRILDGTTRTLMVDDSQIVGQLMIYICSQMEIANYEEYSLIHDLPESEKERTLTLKKQDRTLQRDYKKMEELKKKLHTDDDIAWLDHSKTLRQQGIDESSTLILKRKFFFSDKNIDTRDPVQLNLLYVQCRDAIINGTHPISEEEAIKFAAIQCQVKLGDYKESIHKPGILDLKEYLPKEYIKVKGIEKKILQEFKTSLGGLSELDAKLKYTQLCRSLKTYGVTFFLVKEKMKGKNKLVARLLGITKDSIVRVDEKTKEFLNVYPLECVKKWAASPNTFTLDFGDHYKEPFYSMQTTEGEHIARLISGYVDIILKKKKIKDFNGSDAAEESPMLEEIISPSKATVIQMNKTNMNQVVTGNVLLPGILRNGQETNDFSNGSIVAQNSNVSQQAQLGFANGSGGHDDNNRLSKYNLVQRPLVITIQNARSVIDVAQANLQQRPVLGEIGNDPASVQWKANMLDVNKQKVTSHLSAMNAATAQVVTLTSGSPQSTDYNAVGAAVSCISTNLGDFSKDVVMIAALQDEPAGPTPTAQESDRLLDAAKRLCSAFTDFLRYVEPDCQEPRQNLFSSVGRIGEAGNEIIKSLNNTGSVGSGESPDSRLQDSFIGLAKLVASSTAGLVISSKNVASHCESQQGVNEVIALVTQCALSTSQLVTCTKVCASTIGSRECQEQIIEAARQVSRQVDAVIEVANAYCPNEQALAELKGCAKNVTDTVLQLLEQVKSSNEQIVFSSSVLMATRSVDGGQGNLGGAGGHSGSPGPGTFSRQDESIEKIFNATDSLFNCIGDSAEMIRQAKVLAQATTELVNSLKQDAHEQTTSDQQRKLLMAAKLLAEATSKMVEAAKGCAQNPNDAKMQNNLKKAAEDLKNATTIAAGDAFQIKTIKRLELCAKQAASCATQSIAAIQVCAVYTPGHDASSSDNSSAENGGSGVQFRNQITNQAQTHNQLIQQCKIVADNVPKIVQGIRGCMVAPRSKSAHLGLINSCEDFLAPAQKMISLSKAVLPTISDEIKAIQLRNCTNQLAAALAELKSCLTQSQEVCGSFEADTMVESLRALDKELVEVKKAAQAQSLRPLPGETLELCETQLAAASKTVGLAMAQMLTAAAQGNELYTGIASKDTLNALHAFTSAVRAIAACSAKNPAYQEKLIESARLVLDQSTGLVNETKLTLLKPADSSQNQQRLAQIARTIAQSLYECVNCLPGQKDIDEVIKSIAGFSSAVLAAADESVKYPQTSKPLGQVQSELNAAALALNQATNQLVLDSRKGSHQLAQSAYHFSTNYGAFFQSCLTFAGLGQVRDAERVRVLACLRELHASSSKLLQAAKTCIADPNAAGGRQQLALAVKQVTEAINTAASLCLETNNPALIAQRECDNALRDIETTRTVVQAGSGGPGDELVISEPPPALSVDAGFTSYYDCLDQIIDKSRLLGESMTGIANSCKEPTNPALFARSIKDTSASICGLVETAVHSAYIIGVSDAGSKRGRPAVLDSAQFVACSQRIQDTCATLQGLIKHIGGAGGDSQAQKQQLIQAATQIAQATASLCNASQQASNRTNNVLAKRHFVQSAKQVANTTANFVKSIKAFDSATTTTTPGEVSEFTHEVYSSLVKPLLESVESLCQYALSPEFASVPAAISHNGARAQQPILAATRTMLDAASQLVQASRSLIATNKDPQMWQLFSSNSKIISESIKRLATAIKERAPAKAECDQALACIDKCMKHLENSLISVAMSQPLPLSDLANAKSLEAYQEHAISCANQIMELVDQVRVAAKGEADKLGYIVTEISQYFEPLVVNVIGCTAKTPFNSQLQSAYLEQAKTVLESASQLLIASKESAGNPKNTSNIHQAIDENADGTKEVLDDLIQTLEEATAQDGHVSSMVENLARSIARMDLGNKTSNNANGSGPSPDGQKRLLYVEHQTKIVQLAKLLQQNTQDLNMCLVNELGQCAQQLTQTFGALAAECSGAVATCGSKEMSQLIKTTTQELGRACVELVKLAGRLQNSPKEKMLREEFLEQIESVGKRTYHVLHSFQTSAKGTQACINADNAVNGIIADLNTVIMFATAGTLKSENDADSFNDHRESVLRTAKTLVEDTKALVSVSGQPVIAQDELAQGVHTGVRTITRLADAVKLGAASLGCEQPDAQVLLINAVKDVASSLSELIGAIKLVSTSTNGSGGGKESTPSSSSDLGAATGGGGGGMSEYSANLLRESAKNMITNVQSLLKTVKTVEDEAARGTRALESAIEAIYQEIKQYSAFIQDSGPAAAKTGENNNNNNSISTKPEDLIRATKQITLATSKAIGAGNSLRQEDVIAAANMGRKAVSDLLFVCRGATSAESSYSVASLNRIDADNHQQRQILNIGLNCAIYYKELLECIQAVVNKTASSADGKQSLIAYSKNVANTVSDILQIAELLKGSDYADPEDPTVIAENELLGAANAIESAAKKLSALKPRTKTETIDENLNFDEQILEAAKSITNAAGVLIKAATAAQKELVSQGKRNRSVDSYAREVTSSPLSSCSPLSPVQFQPTSSQEEDGQWSQGLISAAQMVAAACHTLCEAANGLVQGHATEERLISSAKQVASSTAALLVACKVKADITSQAMKRLQHAGNAIKRATDALVRAAQQAVEANEDDQLLELNTKFVGSMAQEIMLREEILRKERELKAAQAKYNAVKKARYQREEDSPASLASNSSSGSSSTNTISNNNSSANGNTTPTTPASAGATSFKFNRPIVNESK